MEAFDLNQIHVKSPCTVPWETMTGDERTRFCAQCKLNVYNLSDMTKADAEAMVQKKEGRLCVRYIKRADGTVLTRDCGPVRAARLRRAAALAVAATLTLIFNVAFWFGRSRPGRLHPGQDYIGSGPATGGKGAFERARQSQVYQSVPVVRATVDSAEETLYPRRPGQTFAFTGVIYE